MDHADEVSTHSTTKKNRGHVGKAIYQFVRFSEFLHRNFNQLFSKVLQLPQMSRNDGGKEKHTKFKCLTYRRRKTETSDRERAWKIKRQILLFNNAPF
jgi:hypothetical protein